MRPCRARRDILCRKRMISLISDIRNSHPDMKSLYMQGQCYNFALILRGQYPGGKLWYSYKEGHMYYFIYGKYFDIRGMHHKRPPYSEEYNFRNGHPAYRWGKGDTRRLIETARQL